MKLVKIALLSAVLLFALGACGNKVEDAVNDWSSAACKCEDEACAKKQKEKFNEIEHKFKKEIDEMSKDDLRKINKKLEKANECLKKFGVRAG